MGVLGVRSGGRGVEGTGERRECDDRGEKLDVEACGWRQAWSNQLLLSDELR